MQQMVVEHLRDKYLLLVLDNCEHLLDACAEIADDILRHCSRVVILASSREALGISGETTYRVPSLSVPDPKTNLTPESLNQFEAVRLFIERADQVQPGFAVNNESAPALASICARLDGIPLAIELAAARIRSMSPQEINQRLDQRFRLLTGGSRTALPRQQTLRSMIDWSFDLLNDRERILFERLSVFSGGWSLQAAEEICSSDPIEDFEVMDLLSGLVDKSLVAVDLIAGETRYRLLETVRQYARDKFAESKESEIIRSRHLAFFVNFAEAAGKNLEMADQAAAVKKFELDQDNIRAALDWSAESPDEGLSGVRIVGSIWRFLDIRGDFGDAISIATRALNHPGAQERTIHRARSLVAIGNFWWSQGRPGLGGPFQREALSIFEEVEDKVGIARCTNNLALIEMWKHNFDECERLLAQSLENSLDELNRWISVGNLGSVALWRGDAAKAKTYYIEAIEGLSGKMPVAMASTYATLGMALLELEGPQPARKAYEESLRLIEGLPGAHMSSVMANAGLAVLHSKEGDFKKADAFLARLIDVARKLGPLQCIVCCEAAGQVALHKGDATKAAELLWIAFNMRDELEVLAPIKQTEEFREALEAANQSLSEEEFKSCIERGAKLSVDDAMALAMKV